MTMRIYVGTYAKYNDGNLLGKWLDLEDYIDKEEFLKACAELHSDEEDPEFMFQDWEGIPDDMINESHISPECWTLLDAYEKYDEDAVKAYIYCFGEWNESEFQDRYRGEYDSWEDFAEQLVDELGYLDEIPEHLRYYFDYEKYARDLRLGGDFCEEDGHYFWNN